MRISTEPFSDAATHLPISGRHILAQQSADKIVVYQAYNEEIAAFAVENGRLGGASFSYQRMSWIKPGFLWMMYRSGWATKLNQKRVLALWMDKRKFEQLLEIAVPTSYNSAAASHHVSSIQWREALAKSDVLLQWDPDHLPGGEAHKERRTLQLGLRGRTLEEFGRGGWIEEIEDITDFVTQQRELLERGEMEKLLIPVEETFRPADAKLAERIGLSSSVE